MLSATFFPPAVLLLLLLLFSEADRTEVVLDLVDIGIVQGEVEQSVLKLALNADHIKGSDVVDFADAILIRALKQMLLEALQVVHMMICTV